MASFMRHTLHAIPKRGNRCVVTIHRDVSPHNILVSYSGQVKLTDFGVARAEGRRRTTQGRLICGKPGIHVARASDGRRRDLGFLDLFSLGVTLFGIAGRPTPVLQRHTASKRGRP